MSARLRFSYAMAVTARRSCCCTAIRGPRAPGIASPRAAWWTGSPPSARIYAATADPPARRRRLTTPHSKRAVSGDLTRLMRRLGHDRFGLVGHDRGSYVALRLTLDNPDLVSRLALVDCIPISEHLARADARFAARWWHWFFFAQPEIPERVINADPDSWYRRDPSAVAPRRPGGAPRQPAGHLGRLGPGRTRARH
jgi:pimeloyl-ACP methyl ester carboxylesterase